MQVLFLWYNFYGDDMKTFKTSLKLMSIFQLIYFMIFIPMYLFSYPKKLVPDIIAIIVIIISIILYFLYSKEVAKNKKIKIKKYHLYNAILWIVFTAVAALLAYLISKGANLEEFDLFDSHFGPLGALYAAILSPFTLIGRITGLDIIPAVIGIALFAFAFNQLTYVYGVIVFMPLVVLIIGLLIKLIKLN